MIKCFPFFFQWESTNALILLQSLVTLPYPAMASHAQLSQAKRIAKINYEIRKDETEDRARPPGGQNANKRLLEKGVEDVNEAWINYFNASLTFVTIGNLC